MALGTDPRAPLAWVSPHPGTGLSLAAMGAGLDERTRDVAPVVPMHGRENFSASIRDFFLKHLSCQQKTEYN